MNELSLINGFSLLVLTIHFILLAILCLFGAHRLSMVIRWFFHKNYAPKSKQRFSELPKITVQIPLFNERLVAQRIIESVCQLNYPKDKLQIQIVDDSTDETKTLVARYIQHYQSLGFLIEHQHRTNRQGYKAGALKEAMADATGEFIAIFDADFIPTLNCLIDNIHHFTDKKVGLVQFRWGHLNKHSSQLTKTQAIMLDAHFALEQQVRASSEQFFNFNGTAGIWRTKTIIDAGHWSADTLTEDLDLSYRAQLAGWKMVYLNDVEIPAELPADMNAFKSQQYRWAKGGIQVMLKLLPTVWRAKIPLTKKIEASFHLANNLAYFFMLTDTLLFLLPSLWLREKYNFLNFWWFDVSLLFLASGGHLIFLFWGQVALKNSKTATLLKIPNLLLLGVQLAINNTIAGFEALQGKKSEFVRTPKSGELGGTSTHKNNDTDSNKSLIAKSHINLSLYQAIAPRGALVELVIGIIYCIVFYWAVNQQQWFMTPLLFLLALGFIVTSIKSLLSFYKLSRS